MGIYMEIYKLFLITLFLVPQSLSANQPDDNTRGVFLDLGIVNEEAQPELFMPIRWEKNIYSGFGLRGGSSRFDESYRNDIDTATHNSDFFIQEDRYRINIISYEWRQDNEIYVFGFDYESISRVEEEYGYAVQDGTLAIATYNYLNNLDVFKLSLTFNYENKINNILSFKVGASYSPAPSLDYRNEDYVINGTIFTAGSSNNYSQSDSYALTADVEIIATSTFNIGFNIQYEYLPLKYERAFVGVGALVTAESEYETFIYSLKFIFKKPLFGDVKPVVGYKNIIINRDSEELSNDSLLVIGVENRF